MRHFLKIADNAPVGPIQQVLWANPDLWNLHRFRTTFPGTPHVDVDDIWLRFSPDMSPEDFAKVQGDCQPVWHDEAKVLGGAVKDLVLNLMRATNSYQLDRLLISRIPPGGQILPHADVDGAYVHTLGLARYHVVIQGLPGSLFFCGGEEVCMLTGEIWWFNAHQVHSVRNNSRSDRIHMLVDLRTWP
jgi:hypothetical protein